MCRCHNIYINSLLIMSYYNSNDVYQPNPTVAQGIVGIDFGTTYSKISLVKKGPNGYVNEEIKDETGENSFPSIIYFDKNGNISFGNFAKEKIYDKSAIVDCKRLIGQNFENPSLEKTLSKLKNVQKSPDGTCSYFIENTKRTISAEEAVKIIFQELKKILSRSYPLINDCFITVPVMYSAYQKSIIKEAAVSAGLKPIRVLSESTAAAISTTSKEFFDIKKHILVIDIGGGTTDVSLLSYSKNNHILISINGDNLLGGEDIDDSLTQDLYKKFLGKGYDYKKSDKKYNKLLKKVRKFKIKLASSRVEQTIEGGEDDELEIYYSPSDFKKVLEPFMKKLENLITKTLNDSKNEKIDIIRLTGGSSNIKILEEKVRSLFPGIMIDSTLPTNAVSFGSGIMGYLTLNNINFTTTDIVPLSISWIPVDGSAIVIVPKGTKIPCKCSFSANVSKHYTGAYIQFCEGDSKLGIYNNILSELSINGFTKADTIYGEVEVTLHNEINIYYRCSHTNGKINIDPKKYIKDIQYIEEKMIEDKQNNELISSNKEKVRLYQLRTQLNHDFNGFQHLIYNNQEKIRIQNLINQPFEYNDRTALSKFLENNNISFKNGLSSFIKEHEECVAILRRYIDN